jgi:hypothetical protein
MLKLLICIFSGALLAVVLLQMRQQRMELSYQLNALHNEIEDSQARLWSQQIEIAVATAPNAIAQTIGEHKLKLAPPKPLPANRPHWIDVPVGHDPDAE